jgi:transcription-repair coupling factor (superfamily II helicase)
MPARPKKSSAAESHLLQVAKPLGALAVALLRLARDPQPKPLFFIARDANRAEALREILLGLAPRLPVALFPAWDCPPYDRATPSRAVMGTRMGVLRWLADRRSQPDLVLTTPDALIRRVPPRSVWPAAHTEFRVGEVVDLAAVEAALRRVGYVFDERVDEAGEAAIRGRVIDVFPAAASMPCRIEHESGLVTAIHSYDPVTQRSVQETETLTVDPASEIVFEPAGMQEQDGADEAAAFPHGEEHWLPSFYPALETIFDFAGGGGMIVEEGADERAEAFFEQVSEGYESEHGLRDVARPERTPPVPDHLYLTREEWQAGLADRLLLTVESADADGPEVPRFAGERNPVAAFTGFAAEQQRRGRRLVLAGRQGALRPFMRSAKQALAATVEPAADWDDVLSRPQKSLSSLPLPLEAGFIDASEGTVVVAAADLLGSRAAVGATSTRDALPFAEEEFHLGDAVVHLDHGVGMLEGLDELATPEGAPAEAVRLRYARDARLMVPVDEIGSIWRYGSDPEALSLDRLDGDGWAKRRARVEEEVAATAAAMAEAARRRNEIAAPKLVPRRRDYERFASRFSYQLTPDQSAAADAILADMASGRPMDRLVCGDVGYGKTEVALRAAAAAVFAGRQVAIVAPTTVLVRQHLRALRRRFAGFGIEVAQLSRLIKPAEAREVRQGLASGDIRVVVGTHALAAKGVTFAELGLLVIDEEQRFGARHKERLREHAAEAHVLTLTATPIPRTLQAGLVGLQDISIISTPPALRQPVRTILRGLDPTALAEALRRERQRRGQSFIVCPRIEDIEPMAELLSEIVPELVVAAAHGEMPAAEIDEVMMDFADGKGDVLLATNIIESGLDVPNANTMVIWRADRFGLAQLHQLRGRVGRGSRRGTAFLLTEPDSELSPETEKRLRAVESLDQLGAGFAISASDLDLRGAGDLLGEEQTGHVKLIGIALYKHLVQRALKLAEGKTLEEDWSPEVHVGIHGRIPADYLPEEEVRVNVHARLAAAIDASALSAVEEEIVDRFGTMPDEMRHLFALAEIRITCRALGVSRLDGGPEGLATSFRPGVGEQLAKKGAPGEGMAWIGERLVLKTATDAEQRLEAIGAFLRALKALGAGT